MNKPAKIVFTDEASFTHVKSIVWIPIAVIAFGFGLALFTTDATQDKQHDLSISQAQEDLLEG